MSPSAPRLILALASVAFASSLACSSIPDGEDAVSEGQDALTGGSAITSALGTFCLDDYKDAATDGNKVQIWSCGGDAAQQWTSTRAGTLVSATGKCLGVHGGQQTSGNLADIYECNGSAGQKWTVAGNAIHSYGGLCLAVVGNAATNGALVEIATCNGSSGQAWKVSGASSSGAKPSPGCGKTGAKTGLQTKLPSKDGAGNARTYDLQVSAPYDATTARPLAFVYHGLGADSATAEGFGLQDAPGAAAAGIFAFPQGIAQPQYGLGQASGWNDLCTGGDMAFFDDMLATIENDYCVDESRIFVAGFSWGGDQTVALDCCRGEKLRGVAVASATEDFSTMDDYRTYFNPSCQAGTAGIRFTHTQGGDWAYPAPAYATTSDLLRAWDGCGASSTAISPSPCVAYASCRKPVVECDYPTLGHALPSGWGDDTWAFFKGL
jgi:poly(3-hydroxybutyrate) depolymerase